MKKKKFKPTKNNRFKVITRKLQKRKDGKKVYSYFNKTDGIKATRADWVLNDDIKKNLRRIHGAGDWQIKFSDAVRDIKREEQREIKHENTQLAKEIEKYRVEHKFSKEDGSPKESKSEDFFNQSIASELELHTKGAYTGNFLIKSGEKYYLPTEKNTLEFRFFVNDLADYFFEYIKENLPKKTLKSFSEGKISPAITFRKQHFINDDYPDLFIFDLDKTGITDDVPYMEGEFNKEKKRLEKLYFSNFKTVNIYNYIKKNGKVKAEKPKHRARKTKKRKK